MLSSAELPVEFTGDKIVTFSSPDIDLIAYRIDSARGQEIQEQRLILCFRARERVSHELFVQVVDQNSTIIEPLQPSVTWPTGQIVVVKGWVSNEDSTAPLKIGLFSKQLDQQLFLSIVNWEDNLYPIILSPTVR